MDLTTIQEIINKRAAKRLEADLTELNKSIDKFERLFKDFQITIVFPDDSVSSKNTLGRLIRFEFCNKLKAANYERYIEEEGKLFVSDVENLKQRMNELENGIEYES